MMTTNANDAGLAGELSGLGDLDAGQGTLVSVVVRKKGVARGPATARVVYGDDTVHSLIWSGFTYRALVERSYKKLHEEWSKGSLMHNLLKEVQDAGCATVTVHDVAAAVQEIDESFKKVLASTDEDDNPLSGFDEPVEPEKAPIWEPLKVNGQTVRGAKVYIGEGNAKDPRSPVKGNVYLDGVKLGEKVLTSATNGAWKPKQQPKTVAKEILKARLPVGLYVRYLLDRESMASVKIGSAASAHAKQEGVLVDPEAIRSLFKVAA